jgi:hypothetical protein
MTSFRSFAISRLSKASNNLRNRSSFIAPTFFRARKISVCILRSDAIRFPNLTGSTFTAQKRNIKIPTAAALEQRVQVRPCEENGDYRYTGGK